ncbi:MAG: FAD-dependent oxidoreductase [Clostridiaceae bacterium]|jgi:ferredoxin-NADP reductase|nr:FAD-dependent oxidoreductase [Oscillospiraceae bacterium]NLO62901.1 FAD-dependent oxidoreductase [Clostridiaceae bacterium]
MILSDITGVFRKSVATVDSVENPFEDYYLIRLIPAPGVSWTPGEHGIFRLPLRDIKAWNWRPFSVASIPEEGVVLIGTRTGQTASPFKRRFLQLDKGSPVKMNGPFGWFKLKDATSPVVFFAAGVGITPIRALLLSLRADTSRDIEIVYASGGQYLFGEEIEGIVRDNPKMTLYKTTDPESTRTQLAALAAKHDDRAYYFLSAAPGVIRSVRRHLRSSGISRKRIIDDTFRGYRG